MLPAYTELCIVYGSPNDNARYGGLDFFSKRKGVLWMVHIPLSNLYMGGPYTN